jgi:hypothetical protein
MHFKIVEFSIPSFTLTRHSLQFQFSLGINQSEDHHCFTNTLMTFHNYAQDISDYRPKEDRYLP